MMALATTLFCVTLFGAANYANPVGFHRNLTVLADTTPLKTAPKDTIQRNRKDTLPLIKDTSGKLVQVTDTVDLKVSKDSLDAPVEYTATDSMVMIVPAKKIWLYSKANIKQKDVSLDANRILIDQETQTVYAYGTTDTAKNYIGRPHFVQGENNMDADTMAFNFKTQKGITKNTATVQGEMYVQSEKMKKINENEYFAYRGQFTTCDLDVPHFAFRTKKMKLVNKKLAVSGPVHPEFEGVPVPIYIPFGFFPLSQGRHSGILPPTFTTNEQFGLGLEGMGYYKVLNDYFDATLRGDLYSYGGYRINLTPTYRVRYRYQGTMTLSYQNSRILADAGKQDFFSTKTFNINWNHSVDSRARPGQNFSANVNAGSTKFNQLLANNPYRNFQNQLSSSVTFSKMWKDKFNLTMSANHQQNNNTRLMSMNLPNANFTVNNFYPFQRKEFVGESKWYEKLGVGLNTSFANQISFYDSAFSFRQLVDTLQWGMQHTVPIQLSLPQLGPFQIGPGISFRENWYSRQFERRWNGAKVETVIRKGFYRSSEMSFSLGVNTALYGTMDKFKKTSSVMAIRHVMRPTFSMSYKPDLAAKDYYTTQVDSTGRQLRFSYYDGSIFGPMGEGEFGGMSFGIDNFLEMKKRSKTDTTEAGIKKVRLIDGFGANSSYNFLADSFKLSPITLYLRSTLAEKINITAGATMDPYQIDSLGTRKNAYAWKGDKFSLGRITNGNVSISANFQSKPKDEKKAAADGKNGPALNRLNQPLTLEEQQQQLQFVRNNPAEFADFNVPWSLQVSYSLNFSRLLKSDYSGFKTEVNSSLNFSGDFNLTPKWKMGLSSYYDFKEGKLANTTAFLSREMHCWQLSINYTRGLYNMFSININPKSSLLRDVKVNRTRYFYNQ